MTNPTLLVVGAGPGVSGSLARRLAREGYDVALVGLGVDSLAALARSVREAGAAADWAEADVTDAAALTEAVTRLAGAAGRVDVLHFNPSAYRPATPLELGVPDLLRDVALGAGSLLTAVQAARPWLREGSRVTATGSVAADRPDPRAASLGVQKAALRNLVQSLDRALAPEGVRAVTVTVDGVIDRTDPGSPFHPDAIAEALVEAARQPVDGWRSEVRHPRRGR